MEDRPETPNKEANISFTHEQEDVKYLTWNNSEDKYLGFVEHGNIDFENIRIDLQKKWC